VILFLQYGTITDFTKLQETISDFPAVTVCNLNPIDVSSNANAGNNII
jgi:hypothetical protein